ncbi:MAG: sugar ABC transporter permease [Anaerolineae bacterium]|nr:sugar ABC transporter permease [Anaerolineae bacterium]MDL1916473.1 sugar ABC transporter permease [Anaerolineae bacterium CFX4]NOG50133.1 sugar ABC transporter permease [Chloroflexota bacterium]GIK27737.1 MAG: sugar ABC transporter permease [Chloroflexota bacterium]
MAEGGGIRGEYRVRRTLGDIVFNSVVDFFDGLFRPIQALIGSKRMPYVFVLPNLLVFVIFILIPMILNFSYAFTGGQQFFLADRTPVGGDNFAHLFDCGNFLDPNTCREDTFWIAMFNTVWFVVLQVGALVVVSLGTALVLNQKIKARAFFRSVFFYPVLLSPVVVALIWRWILQNDGLLNALIVAFGGERLPFLVSVGWTRFWVVFISVWSQMGFYTLILLAGLQSIPTELYEASSIDGANRWQAFRRITLPLLMPTMLVVLVLSVIRAVQSFDIVYAFSNGGPGTATTFMVQYIFNTAFMPPNQYGLAAAASLVLASILLILTLIQLRVGRQSELA